MTGGQFLLCILGKKEQVNSPSIKAGCKCFESLIPLLALTNGLYKNLNLLLLAAAIF
jgi:hypothetical protein